MASEGRNSRILMLPYLAHGHIFPYLELAKRILNKKNFHIHFCSTAVNFSSINRFIQGNSLDQSIELVEIHLQPPPELPPHYHTTKNLPSNLKRTLVKAFQTAKPSFSDIMSTLKPDLVIYDVYQPWAAGLASSRGVPAVHFSPFGAAVTSFFHHKYVLRGRDFPFPELCPQDHVLEGVNAFFEFLNASVYDHDEENYFVNYKLSSEIVLLKASRGLEGKYIDGYVSSISDKRILSVGPLVADVDENEEEDSEILQWLSKKNEHSTVYISFGSEFFLSKEEIEEIAKGLERCDVDFIWGIRSPPGEETNFMEEALPQGFLDRVKGKGIVVSGWTPQAKILAHPSTGAFVSHCGWSSLNESMYFGVPVIPMPRILDHHVGARLFVAAGAGVEVPREENEVFKGDEIAKAINKAIVEKSGEGLRRRVQELSEKMRMEEEQEIEVVAEQLWQLCFKNKGKE